MFNYLQQSHISLLISSDLIVLIMSLSSNCSEERLLSIIEVWLPGTLLLLSNQVHWGAKKLLKWFAFILNSEMSSLFIKSGTRIFFKLKTRIFFTNVKYF